MRCPFCSGKTTKVLDKRESGDYLVTRRRRQCIKCKRRFTTYERAEFNLMVVKKDGRRESFNRDKLLNGILKACEKRPINNSIIDQTANDIENELRTINKPEIKTSVIGNLVMNKLKKIDKVAYIRFASVYRDFQDIASFETEVKKLKNRG